MSGIGKVSLGRTRLSISPLCFGLAPLGDMPDTYGYSVSIARAHETVRAVFDGPVNFLDTSRNYGMGRSEQRIGEVIAERGGIPKGFVISSKLDRDIDTLQVRRRPRAPVTGGKPQGPERRPHPASPSA